MNGVYLKICCLFAIIYIYHTIDLNRLMLYIHKNITSHLLSHHHISRYPASKYSMCHMCYILFAGLGNCLAPIFLSEMSPCNLRGALGTVHQLFITLGIFFSSVFGLESILGKSALYMYRDE